MEDLRKCWKVPYIVYYCNLFEQKLDLIDLRVDEFEEAILDDCGQERNIVIIHLLQKLLKPFINRTIDLTNYEQFLLSVLKKYSLENLYLQEQNENQWNNLSMLTKLDIIYWLCELRLQLADVETKLTEYEPNELRIEPLGLDSNGNKLWYFGDLRLYQELPPPPSTQKEKSSKANKKKGSKLTKEPVVVSTKPINKNVQKSKKNVSKSKTKKTSKKKLKNIKKNRRSLKNKKETSSEDGDDDDDDYDDESDDEEDDLKNNADEELDEDLNLESVNGEISTDEDEGVASETLEESEETPVVKNTRSRRTNVLPATPQAKSKNSTNTRKSITNDIKKEVNTLKSPSKTSISQQKLNDSVANGLRRSSRRSLRSQKELEDEEEEEQKINETVEEPAKVKIPEEIIDKPIIEKQDRIEESPDSVESQPKSSSDNMQESIVDVENVTSIKEELINPKTEEESDLKTPRPTIKTEEEISEEEKQLQQDHKEMLEIMEIINKNKLERQQNQKRVEELEIYKDELQNWSCICLTLDDWVQTAEKYKKSKKKVDQEIAKLIEESYLTEMPALFQKAEKERMHRLLALAPKRQSQRLQTKQQIRSENSENESKDTLTNTLAPNSIYLEYNSDGELDTGESNDENKKLSNDQTNIPLTEQERLKRDEIARQREERLKQRLLRRELNHNQNDNSQMFNQDETSQASNYSGYSSAQHAANGNSSSCDFNIRNFFLMHKVLTKVLQSKYAWPFKDAVSEDDAPDYNSIIECPMNLSIIQLKINKKAYKSRQAFVDDLELIVKNCIAYNGEESFYGKLALKFENYFKRWLHIFFPREISTSLEEKNRQLMKLIVNRSNPNQIGQNGEIIDQNGENATNENINTNSNSLDGGLGGANGEFGEHDESHHDENRPSALLFDFSNNSEMMLFNESMGLGGTIRKKRKPNPDKEKYLQEPQYVTKRTSSGRLVKMKIINDFDYTSDQEKDGKRKKKENEEDEDGIEGIQRKHRKNPDQDSLSSMSSDAQSDNSDDEDFLGRKTSTQRIKTVKIKSDAENGERQKRVYRQTPGRPRQRRTIKQLTESSINHRKYEDDDETSDDDMVGSVLKNRNQYEHDSDNDLNLTNFKKRFLNDDDSKLNTNTSTNTGNNQPPKLTFEQYVKKLTGNYTVGQAVSAAPSTKQNTIANMPSSPSVTNKTTVLSTQLESGPRFSLKVTPAPSISKPTTMPSVYLPSSSTTTASTATPANKIISHTVVPSTVNTTTLTNTASAVTNFQPKQQSSINIPGINSIGQSYFITKPQQQQLQPQQQSTIISNVQIEINKSKTVNETTNSMIDNTSATNPSSISTSLPNLAKKFVIINPMNGSNVPISAPTSTSTTTSTTTTTTTNTNGTNQLSLVNNIIKTSNQPIKIINISQINKPAFNSIPQTQLSNSNIQSGQIRTQILSPILNKPQIVMINTNNLLQNKVINSTAISLQQHVDNNNQASNNTTSSSSSNNIVLSKLNSNTENNLNMPLVLTPAMSSTQSITNHVSSSSLASSSSLSINSTANNPLTQVQTSATTTS